MLILNTPIVRIEQIDNTYVLKLRTSSGKFMQCKPYDKDLKGMIAALTLAIDALAGKVWLDKMEEEPNLEKLTIEQRQQRLLKG